MGREVGSRVKRGAYARLWLISVDAWQKPTQYCKAIILPLKINLKIFKLKNKGSSVTCLGSYGF